MSKTFWIGSCVGSVLLTGLTTAVCLTSIAQATDHISPNIVWPESTSAVVKTISVRDVALRDVLRGIAHEYQLNIVVDDGVAGKATLRLSDLPVSEVLTHIASEYRLLVSTSGSIIYVRPLPLPELPPRIPQISISDGLLSADLKDDELDAVIRKLAAGGLDIIMQNGVAGFLTGTLSDVPLNTGLQTLFESNDFVLRQREEILIVDRPASSRADGGTRSSSWVQASDSLVSIEVSDVPIASVLEELARETDTNIITYSVPEGSISASISEISLDAALHLLLKGTDVTFRKSDGVYIVGKKSTQGIASARLIRLGHIRADAVLDLVPEYLTREATMQIVKEHNGIMVTGSSEAIAETEQFIAQLDYPTPQILIEALVVDFQSTDLFDLGITLGRDPEIAGEVRNTYLFGGAPGQSGGFEANGNSDEANAYLSDLSDIFGIGIGSLPDDFYFRLNALSQEGRANIRSRPQVATLNGHSASISIGTKQYFILKTATPYQGTGNVVVQETERFESIEANVKLDITPWVSSSGEVTAEIRPEFSTPIGDLDPQVPPTINSRVLDSTVRLQDGETIILGGLIQDIETSSISKVPILGSIPLLGKLFRNRSRSTVKSELVIFLTPHVFYGDQRDNATWNELRKGLGLSHDKQNGFLEIIK
ncbi:MAG: type II secretion system protein GspD [Rhodothermales bacterium]|nr:type II secretion system protein GspD [Rhodothermales bacterium]